MLTLHGKRREIGLMWNHNLVRPSHLIYLLVGAVLDLSKLIFLFLLLYREAWSYGCGSGGFDDYTATTFLTKRYARESCVRCLSFFSFPFIFSSVGSFFFF